MFYFKALKVVPPTEKVAFNKVVRGFTLAEVLVTLGIIGVVSSMTMPTLMQNYQRKSYVTQLHKVYNEISQAAVQFQTDKNAVNLKEAGLNSQTAADEFIEKYFKIVQKCGDTQTPCFASFNQYKKLTGTGLSSWITPRTHYTIASGASIGIKYRPNGDVLCEIFIDINGAKGPNIAGRDLFPIFLYNNGILDDNDFTTTANAPMTKETRENVFNTVCNSSGSGWNGCFGKILNDNWEMTY